jgi:hypothetical protein
MDGIYLIFCLAMIVFLASVGLVIIILKSGSKERPRKRENPGADSSTITEIESKDLSPQIHLERSKEFRERYNTTKAKKHAVAAFRSGDRAIRLQVVKLLSALHEVEEF